MIRSSRENYGQKNGKMQVMESMRGQPDIKEEKGEETIYVETIVGWTRQRRAI